MSFEREKLKLKPLGDRVHDLNVSCIKEVTESLDLQRVASMEEVAQRMTTAKDKGRAIIFMMGAHVIRSGVQKYIMDLLDRGFISCLAMNGAGIIHDYEFSRIGETTESVARYIKTGEFGMWKETGFLNDIINSTYKKNSDAGMGGAVGKAIVQQNMKYQDVSLLAKCYTNNIPATVHVSIGQDIIHQHPNCNGAATGALSYNDFLKFTSQVQRLEGGVVMNFGSNVMAPEVFLKALSMARNIAGQRGEKIKKVYSLVCDLHDLPGDYTSEPSKGDASYYFRPWKTMLVRTVAEGGESCYIKGHHAETIPALWTAIKKLNGF